MNLTFDLNYILHKNVQSLHKTNDLYGHLYTKLTDNIKKYVSMNNWDNIFIVSDSREKSWRQNILADYKGKRKKSTDINWDWVYTEYDTWKHDMSFNYRIFQKNRIEGDDWITALILKTNKKNQSNCVISSDGDLTQHVKYNLNGNKSFINIQISDENGREKLYLPEGWNLWYDNFDKNLNEDVFNLDNSCSDITFFDRVKKAYINKEIDHHTVLLKKIIWGDAGDNIKSIYETLTTTGKIRNIGEKTAEKICDFYKQNYKSYFDTTEKTFVADIIKCVENVLNIEFNDNQRRIVAQKIKRNIQLIELHYRHYPENILDEIITELNDKLSLI